MYRSQNNEFVVCESLLSTLAEYEEFQKECLLCVAEYEETSFYLHYCILEPFEYCEGSLPAERANVSGVLFGFGQMLEDERVFWCGRQVGVALVAIANYK